MGKFKVGDRVKSSAIEAKDELGTVVDGDKYGYVLVKFDTWRQGHDGVNFNGNVGKEHWLITSDELALIPSFTITAGRYYKTRDGSKVGPLEDYGSAPGEDLSTAEVGGSMRLFNRDGTHHYKNHDIDIIAEWVDEPAAQPAKASNDNAAPAKFKVGDRVRGYAPAWGEKTGVIVQIDPHDYDQHYRIKDDETDWSMWLENHTVEAAPVLPSAIVALIEDGQPKPATRPYVHATVESATAEAERLAGIHRGQQFGVYVLTTTSQEAAPTYAHEWQRLAAKGEKIAAIKELRGVTGMGLKPTKDAVEYFLAAA